MGGNGSGGEVKMNKTWAIIKLLRPQHWLKNILVAVPLFFSMGMDNAHNILIVLLGFITFSAISSAVYVMNDIADKEKDKKHSIKCKRPIAAGLVSERAGVIIAVSLLLVSLALNYCACQKVISPEFFVLLVYFLINIWYSLGGGKKIPIIDVSLLAAGFLLRVLYGCVIIDVQMSNWLYLTIIAFAYYMGLGKRRGELNNQGEETREVLSSYGSAFLNNSMSIFMALTLVFYSLWVVDESTIQRVGNEYLVWSVPIVIIICLKYGLNIEKANEQGDPVEVLLKDKVLIGLCVVFALYVFGVFYL